METKGSKRRSITWYATKRETKKAEVIGKCINYLREILKIINILKLYDEKTMKYDYEIV